MTTIACNLKEMAADTKVSFEGIGTDVFSGLKLYKSDHAIFGLTGGDCSGQIIGLEWLKLGGTPGSAGERPIPPKQADWLILELSRNGIAVYNEYLERDPVLAKYIAVGSGRKVAMYCMKVLGMSPVEAVREACKADDWSDTPIYIATLSDMSIQRWTEVKP